jgi:adenylate cyclase
MSETRKLTTIVAADVAGYGRLTASDEERTVARLRGLRTDLIDPAISVHHGRVVKRTGDGILIEFRSVVDAVRCSIEVQNGMIERNAGLPLERQILFRVGIHLGDVVEESDGDLMGDGVNIAARLEGIAAPGGICLSEDAYRQVRGKIVENFIDLGSTALKNIADPVRVYSLSPSPGAETRLGAATQPAQPSLPDKPSIVVLPFQNMSSEADQEYFADGMVEDIITALSRFSWLMVIARNTSFTYKGKAVDITQIGRDLGVRYALEGSVRKAAVRVRITGQLIECATGAHLWADRFDGSLENVFELQDQVAISVVGAIEPKLRRAEIERSRRKPTESLDAYDYYLRGLSAFHKETRAANDDALALFSRAIELDPNYAAAYGMAAYARTRRRTWGWTSDPIYEAQEGRRLASEAAKIGNDDAVACYTAGWVLAWHDLDAAAALIGRGLTLNPNEATAWWMSGFVQVWLGWAETGIEHVERARRLSPLDPAAYQGETAIANAHLLLGAYEESLAWARKALQGHAEFQPALRVALAACGMLGRTEEAQALVKRLTGLRAESQTTITALRPALAARDPNFLAVYIEGLRRAGVPEG